MSDRLSDDVVAAIASDGYVEPVTLREAALAAEVHERRAFEAKLREQHKPMPVNRLDGRRTCVECHHTHPCPTLRLLDGIG